MAQNNRGSSPTDIAVLNMIERGDSAMWNKHFQVTDKYWRRHNGADHILVMPAPVTNFRHEGSRRGFFHYMIQLHLPIFLNVEFSRSFIHEYPVCARIKNIVMPYPTTDFELFNGNYKAVTARYERKRLLFYQGGNHGSCTEIRAKLNHIVKEIETSEKVKIRGKYWREANFKSAIFCPIPVGDSPSSKRMYDVMNMGCIPVVLSDDIVWAYSKLVGGALNPAAFSIQIPQLVRQLTC